MTGTDGHESPPEATRLDALPATALAECAGNDLSTLLAAVRAGDTGAVARVVAYAYRELHALAQSRVRRAPHNTLLDTTGLLHECYLRLVAVGNLKATDRGQFMAYASRVMRSIIVDAVRSRGANRRGGDRERVPLLTDLPDARAGDARQILDLSDALDAVRAMDERLVTIVELRYFAGLDNTEIADVLQISERTVRREWEKARALLHHELME